MATDPTIINALTATLTFDYGVQIDPNIVSKIPFDSPMFDYLEAQPGAPFKSLSRAATFALLTAADFTSSGDGSFGCGGDPPGLSTTRSVTSLTKKCYGSLAGIKDVDIIASSQAIAPHSVSGTSLDNVRMSYKDDAEFLLNILYVRTRQAIDWAIVRGDIGTSANHFDGLEDRITAANGSQILTVGAAFSKAHLDDLIVQMMMKGITPTAIACNPCMVGTLVDRYTAGQTGIAINMNMGEGSVPLGFWADSIITPAGKLPIVTDRRFSVTSSAPSFTSDIFVLTRQHAGEPILYLDWQVLPTALDLARVPGFYTSQVFAVWSNLVLVEKSSWWAQGRLKNIIGTYKLTPPTPTP